MLEEGRESTMATTTVELNDNEKALLAREVAADRYEPPLVADAADVLRIPRDSFVAGWDAAIAYLNSDKKGEDDEDSRLTIIAVLGKPTRWSDFVETLEVERL
jgi:hypothetical protein